MKGVGGKVEEIQRKGRGQGGGGERGRKGGKGLGKKKFQREGKKKV